MGDDSEKTTNQIVDTVDFNAKATLTNCGTEVPLNLIFHSVTQNDAQTLVNNSKTQLCFPVSGQSYNLLIDQLPKAVVMELENIACELSSSSNCQGTFTLNGVRVYHSLDANNTLKCLYQPVKLCSNESTQLKKFQVFPSSNFYVFNGTSTAVANATQIAEIANYQAKIKFKDISSGNCRDFVDANDETGDFKYVLYSFQELYAIMNENKANYIKFVTFTNTFQIGGETKVRHSILVSPENVPIPFIGMDSLKLIFKDMVGDHANPCPPQCEYVKLLCN